MRLLILHFSWTGNRSPEQITLAVFLIFSKPISFVDFSYLLFYCVQFLSLLETLSSQLPFFSSTHTNRKITITIEWQKSCKRHKTEYIYVKGKMEYVCRWCFLWWFVLPGSGLNCMPLRRPVLSFLFYISDLHFHFCLCFKFLKFVFYGS